MSWAAWLGPSKDDRNKHVARQKARHFVLGAVLITLGLWAVSMELHEHQRSTWVGEKTPPASRVQEAPARELEKAAEAPRAAAPAEPTIEDKYTIRCVCVCVRVCVCV
jgi:hypothetical protein